MGLLSINQKKRGKKGDGRAVIFKALQLPQDIIDDLKLYKNIYSTRAATEKDENGYPIPAKVSFEMMLRHWMDNVDSFDPDVQKEFYEAREIQKEFGQTYYGNPAEGDIWDMSYFFELDGEEIEAIPDEKDLFYAIVNGERKTMLEMMNEEWFLMNEAGIEIDSNEAREVSRILLEHAKNV